MIKSEKEFLKSMRKVIRCVLSGKYEPTADREQLEVVTECIEQGYLLSQYERDGKKVLRTMDGTPHPRVATDTVPLKGLKFLSPDRSNLKSNIALILSALALLVSLFANLDRIITNIASLIP